MGLGSNPGSHFGLVMRVTSIFQLIELLVVGLVVLAVPEGALVVALIDTLDQAHAVLGNAFSFPFYFASSFGMSFALSFAFSFGFSFACALSFCPCL